LRIACIKLDIRKFFPSSSSHYVQRFFEEVLEYPPDVASRARRLLTYDGHLPTGGNASTILSFWAYKPLFDEIDALAKAQGSAVSDRQAQRSVHRGSILGREEGRRGAAATEA